MATLTLVNGSVYWNGTTIPYTASRCCCEFPGAGWYCIQYWESGYGDCNVSLTCWNDQTRCEYIGSQAQWDSWQFDVCQYQETLAFMWKTPGIRYDDDYACGIVCECP